MSDLDKHQTINRDDSVRLHNSDKGITTHADSVDHAVLRHSAPALPGQSRFNLFNSQDKLRVSIERPRHPRRNYGLPHLVGS